MFRNRAQEPSRQEVRKNVHPGTLAVGVAAGFAAVAASLVALGGVGIYRAERALRIDSEVPEPRASGRFGEEHPGAPVTLAMIGDSLAVGVGAERPSQTVGALLACGLGTLLGRPVDLINVAVTGSVSTDLDLQLRVLESIVQAPDVAVIVIGGNDVMQRESIPIAARHLYSAVVRLHRAGSRVVVATCPDMGTVPTLIQPLRFLAHRASRALARAQMMVVLRAGGSAVPLGVTLGPIFVRQPQLMFGADHFHPSCAGYARAASLLLPTVWATFGGPYFSAKDPATVERQVSEAAADAIAQSL